MTSSRSIFLTNYITAVGFSRCMHVYADLSLNSFLCHGLFLTHRHSRANDHFETSMFKILYYNLFVHRFCFLKALENDLNHYRTKSILWAMMPYNLMATEEEELERRSPISSHWESVHIRLDRSQIYTDLSSHSSVHNHLDRSQIALTH